MTTAQEERRLVIEERLMVKVRTAALLFDLSTDAIRDLIHAGQLRTIAYGEQRLTMIPMSELLAWLERQQAAQWGVSASGDHAPQPRGRRPVGARSRRG